jgi:hypothetical protein
VVQSDNAIEPYGQDLRKHRSKPPAFGRRAPPSARAS